MIAARLGCVALASLLLMPSDVLAQGRGNGRANGQEGKGRNGNGPAFCRSGEGHPVHGWAWCREKGWTRDSGFWNRGSADDRDRDDRGRGRGRR